MMKIDKVNEAFGHRIVGGSGYMWNCYGSNARYLDYESMHGYGSAVYDTVTLDVYEVTVNDTQDNFRYRWLNPETKQDYLDACKSRGIDPNNAWDSLVWYDLELATDFCTKANSIINGVEFDTRVEVPLEIEDDVILALALEAHKRDITINKMVELLLQQAIQEHRSVNEQRA